MFSYQSQAEYIQLIQGSWLSWLHPMWMILRYFDKPSFYLLLASLLPALFGSSTSRKYLYLLSFTMYFNHLLKHLCDQPRPGAILASLDLIAIGSHYGFPSGAAMGSIIIAAIFISSRPSLLGWLIATTYVVLIGSSRIYLGAHFPSDILGGWFFGLLTWALYLKLDKSWPLLSQRKAYAKSSYLLVWVLLAIGLYLIQADQTSLSLILWTSGLTLGFLGQPSFLLKTAAATGTMQESTEYRLLTAVLNPLGTILIFLLFKSQWPAYLNAGYLLLGVWISSSRSILLPLAERYLANKEVQNESIS